MKKFIYNRYYTVFSETGYLVRDSEALKHDIVYKGTHPNGDDSKKWMCIHNPELKIGDKIIWDSNFGYEIGTFLGEDIMMNTYLVNLETGICQGEVSHTISDIKLYSNELKDKLDNKYNYK